MAGEKSPCIVKGTVVWTDIGMVLAYAIGSGLLALAAGVVLWDTWSHQDGEYLLPFHLAKDSLFTSFVVGMCLVGGSGCAIAFLCQSLFPQRLVLGEEVLQVIRGQTVLTQVPYSNIARVTCEEEEYGSRQLQVGIDLCQPDAPGMYAPGEDFRKKEENIRDVSLPGQLTTGPEEIARQIVARCKPNAPTEGP